MAFDRIRDVRQGYVHFDGDNGDVILSGLLANGSLGYGRSYWNAFSTARVDRLGQGFFGPIEDYLFQLLPGWFAYQVRMLSQVAAATIGDVRVVLRAAEVARVCQYSRQLRLRRIGG
jgi:hypothetical protein